VVKVVINVSVIPADCLEEEISPGGQFSFQKLLDF